MEFDRAAKNVSDVINSYNNLVLVTKRPYRMLLKTISPYHKVTIQVKMMILMMIEVSKGLFLQKSL